MLPADLAAIVARMNRALQHRGPDDDGQYSDTLCSIAMRRLAIIDLSTGKQPISNEDNTLHIVFNGEIYNYLDLRHQLETSGRHHFKTQSDTEVILHLFEDYGPQTPALLNGMFAFCIYNSRENTLFLARDRFGEKPLFYYVARETFAFSSELASLLEFDAVPRQLNLDALYYYLHLGRPPAPITFFSDIQQLPPGHWLAWSGNDLRCEPYFVPQAQPNPAFEDEHTAKAAVQDCLLQSVKRQMISDVPIGAFLSGGLDSSSIVAAMQRQSSQPVKTFTVRFEYAPYDESPIAREVAQHLGTEHHEFVVTNGGFRSEDLWRIVRHVGQPFSDSSAIPTYLISQQIRQCVTVALSGDGGDEMFAGYNYFRWGLAVDRLANSRARPLLPLTQAALNLLTALPGLNQQDTLRQARRAAKLARVPAAQRIMAFGALFDRGELATLAQADVAQHWQRLDQSRMALLESGPMASRLRQWMNYRLRFSLPEDMLVKVDRMSMAASLEVRAPMLSAEMAALTMQLPDHLLLKNNQTKIILRRAVRDWLPDSVFSHPKTGFNIPLHIFQNADYAQLCRQLLLPADGLLSQLFQPKALQAVMKRGFVTRHRSGVISVYQASHQLWALLQLAAWIRQFNVTL
jgi:asparagine synthase (glutamine-hydrolysing)